MNCPRCQKEIPNTASSCSACGFSFDDATQRFEPPTTPKDKSGSDKRSFTSFDSIDDARFVPGTILADRYRIVGLLGKGGMGEVYRADDLKLTQPVALKFLPDHLLTDGAALARFHREVRVARQVSHKNVCRVYDIGEIDGRHFLSMEYIKGEELSSLMRRIGRLPQDKAVQLARQICAGLAAAHDAGVLHRDLKPANIMIDADGNARVLDFGLAGLVEEFGDDEMRAGTPAYMAPEQIEGKEQTVKSDIYSLGLVFYELFTGKRAFEAPSLHELIKLRRSLTSPTTPTEVVKDLDPVIEKVIDRCLRRDPAQRPSSALQVAAALPGGDPIAAALAAGETPSPEMVAAAPKQGTLRPMVAAALLVSVVVFLGAAMFLSKWATLHRILPLPKSPEILREQASQTVRSLGYANAPADVATGFDADFEYYSYLANNRASLNPWEVLKSSQPPLVYFWYRQSPALLVPMSEMSVSYYDPPRDTPGMVQLRLDTDGRLIYFEAAPDKISPAGSLVSSSSAQSSSRSPARETQSANPETSTPDWSGVFRAAGLDVTQFAPVESQWTPPHAYDVRQAWTGSFPNLAQVPIRIEAASFQGKPVYFEIVSPWRQPVSKVAVHGTTGEKIGNWILFGLFFATMAVGVLFALRNLRLGRGDRRGALRLSLFIFALRLASWALSTHHVADFRELSLLITALQSSLFWAFFVGLMYLALEPYLRRRWPERIISWNRLLAGDFRDPLVGRDLLIGIAIGTLCLALMYSRLIVQRWLGANYGVPDLTEGFKFGMSGAIAFAQMFINSLAASVGQAFMIVFLLLFLSLILRKDWIGILVGLLILILLFTAPSLAYEHWPGQVAIAMVASLLVFSAVRFGPVCLTATMMVFHTWVFFPITTELTAWYASSFVLMLIFIVGMAAYGLYVSLGGQKILSGRLLEER